MLPFVFLDESMLGPFHAYGLAAMLGFFAWDHVAMRQAARRGFDRGDFRICTVWVLGLGTVFAWLIDAVFYHPPGRSVASTLFAFQGFSSTGAFVGALVGAVIWRHLHVRKDDEGRWRASRREKALPLLPVTEVFMATWPVGFAFGRLGCALIHDHPGIIVPRGTVASLFAVAWPLGPEDGVHHVLGPLHVVTGGSQARFDLGLLELFVLAAIAIAFATTWKRDVRLGTYTIAFGLVYGPIRFALDFLRVHDGPGGELRHGGLTFAQYFALTIVALALVLLAKRRSGSKPSPAGTEPHVEEARITP